MNRLRAILCLANCTLSVFRLTFWTYRPLFADPLSPKFFDAIGDLVEARIRHEMRLQNLSRLTGEPLPPSEHDKIGAEVAAGVILAAAEARNVSRLELLQGLAVYLDERFLDSKIAMGFKHDILEQSE